MSPLFLCPLVCRICCERRQHAQILSSARSRLTGAILPRRAKTIGAPNVAFPCTTSCPATTHVLLSDMYLGPRLSRVGLDIHTHSAWNNGPTSQSLQQYVSVRITIGGLAFCKTAPPIPQEQHPKHCCPRQIPVLLQHRLATPRPLPETYLQNHPPTRPPLHIPQSVAKHGRGDEPVMTVFSRTVHCQKAKATSRQLCFSFPCASKSPSRSQANVAGVTRSRIACN